MCFVEAIQLSNSCLNNGKLLLIKPDQSIIQNIIYMHTKLTFSGTSTICNVFYSHCYDYLLMCTAPGYTNMTWLLRCRYHHSKSGVL